MSFWNIQLELKEDGEKNIAVHEDSHISLEYMIEQLIQKYQGTNEFFLRANLQSVGMLYVTENILVTIINKNLACIEFDKNTLSSVKSIRITKRELYLFKNIM